MIMRARASRRIPVRLIRNWALSGVTAALAACAGSGANSSRTEASETDLKEEIEALKRAVEASYDRERAMAERLRVTEEQNVQVRSQLARHDEQLLELAGRSVSTPEPTPTSGVSTAGRFDARNAYDSAYRAYGDRKYRTALGQFGEVVSRAPQNEWADNAQYWMGECYYGLFKFRQALSEFTKVFSHAKTEKADDAQLKIARCYLALGEKDRAVSAFQKLMDEYPKSEYVGTARKEMRYLEGP